VAIYPDDGSDQNTLLNHADAAMYEAKHAGKNAVYFFNKKLEQFLKKKLRVRANLRSALANSEFYLLYQPKFNQFTNEVVGAEALIRWNNNSEGLIPPHEFIPEAEANGTIIEIGNWVLEQACEQARIWSTQVTPPIKVSVNVSAVQIAQANWVDNTISIIKASGVDPKLIELEITESVLIESRKQSQTTFEQLQAMGVTIALDDFGVGYSSLSYLTQFSIDTLKIDRSFIHSLTESNANSKVLKNIYSLAKDLDMQVVSEGVEDSKQLNILAGLNGSIIQGYYYSPPVESDRIFNLLHNKKNS
ncbi:MAG: GGDEF domain-containing phosphodiesterase, partial [Kangiellaceae bacterium]|nr:GGDEF domain-containing phosphodiesterase [Kangiellaceae bacterium]